MNSQPSVCPPCPPEGVPKGSSSGPPEDSSLDARAQRLLSAPKEGRERQDRRPGAGARKTPRPQPPGGAADDLQAGLHEAGLHDALHPGCQDGHCAAREQNLNVSGVVLHVGSDVARTLLMFVTGALLRAGVLKNSAAVDAVCSCLIAGCVTLGCAWMLGKACRPLEQPSANVEGRGATGSVS